MTITTWVIYMAPVGVFFLIGGQILEMDDFSVVAGQLGLYFMTVLIGLFLHGFVVLPIIYTVCTRKLPFRFIANMTNAFTTAFGTASSSATLPVTMSLLEEKNGVDQRISRYYFEVSRPFFQCLPTENLLDSCCLLALPSIWTVQPCTRPWPPFSSPKFVKCK